MTVRKKNNSYNNGPSNESFEIKVRKNAREIKETYNVGAKANISAVHPQKRGRKTLSDVVKAARNVENKIVHQKEGLLNENRKPIENVGIKESISAVHPQKRGRKNLSDVEKATRKVARTATKNIPTTPAPASVSVENSFYFSPSLQSNPRKNSKSIKPERLTLGPQVSDSFENVKDPIMKSKKKQQNNFVNNASLKGIRNLSEDFGNVRPNKETDTLHNINSFKKWNSDVQGKNRSIRKSSGNVEVAKQIKNISKSGRSLL